MADRIGVTLSACGDYIDWEAECAPPAEFLAAIASAKPELLALLLGKACRWCGRSIAWPKLGAGITYADGTAECMGCAEREVGRLLAAGRRAVESADALADPAEMMLQPGGLP